jgi:hypothetical protein
VEAFYKRYKKTSLPLTGVGKFLLDLCDPYPRTYMVVDGFDELPSSAMAAMTSLFGKAKAKAFSKILVASRP